MKLNSCLKTIGLLFGGLTSAGNLSAEQPPNILMIIVDDLRADLGCYGNMQVKTPNIDRLANQGLRFNKAYVQQAVCGPSRVSFLTGMRPENLQIFDIVTPLRSKWPDIQTMPGFFLKNGFQTASIGKVYHHKPDDSESWVYLDDLEDNRYASDRILNEIKEKYQEGRNMGLTGRDLNRFARGPSVEMTDLPDESFIDGRISQAAVKKLHELKDTNFFLAVGFKKPHLPFSAPKKYWDQYDRDEFVINHPEEPVNMPQIAAVNWAELRSYTDIPESGSLDKSKALELKHGYYACITFIDTQIGKILNTLKELSLDENTIIILMSDHGWKLGEYGMWCKHSNFEIDVHVPLLFKGPGIPAGTVTNSLFDYVDIFPTLAKLAGFDYNLEIDGYDQSLLFNDINKKIRNYSYSLYPRGRNMGYSITDGKYRYTAWMNEEGSLLASELYESRDDRISRNNLSGMRKYRKVERNLSKELFIHYKLKSD
jgi:iduronate 2-sulfatase